MFATKLGIFTLNTLTLSTGETIKVYPYSNIREAIESQKGFFLLEFLDDTKLQAIVKNYLLIDDDYYSELTEN